MAGATHKTESYPRAATSITSVYAILTTNLHFASHDTRRCNLSLGRKGTAIEIVVPNLVKSAYGRKSLGEAP